MGRKNILQTVIFLKENNLGLINVTFYILED